MENAVGLASHITDCGPGSLAGWQIECDDYLYSLKKSPQNDHKKIRIPVSQWIKQKLAIELRAKLHQNAFAFAVPGFALLEKGEPK